MGAVSQTMTIAEIINSIRLHGKGTEKYDNVRIGFEFPFRYNSSGNID